MGSGIIRRYLGKEKSRTKNANAEMRTQHRLPL